MEFGAMIKFYRTQKGMTQGELAKGICSVPHLSKIENNSKEANEETIALLLERLNISMEEVEENEEQIKFLLREFSSHINFFLTEKVEQTFQKLQEIEHLIPFSKYIYMWELYKYRYLLFKGLLDEAVQKRDHLQKQKKNFSQHEDYLFRYYNAVFLILKGQYRQADEILEMLYMENEHDTTSGEFYYHLALIKTSLEQSGYAIHFGKMALQIFMSEYNFIRILHTLMLLGINYTHSNILEEAESCFQHLIRNAEILQEESLLPQIFHNMGNLQQKMGNSKKALYYFEKSLAIQPAQNQDYLVTLYVIGELHYSLHSDEKARECFQEVYTLAKKFGIKKLWLLAEFYLLYITAPAKGLKFLETRVIPYLEESNEHADYLFLFYKKLADFYNQEGKAAEAVKYLSKITE
ncbi:tetratricopeptide repeat protein [Neobacillus mesonae]|uniref:tetratricopeptide repeat protein n=1 Tax=Neobacillus mesonae TaxID=1193713 RepID=UPI00203C7886|nr:tetratricopeptide repeat protein [Neobacillus mesonae]MCM3568185.1 tetratricopeptide repeat protein [Neobacillus mesonae]